MFFQSELVRLMIRNVCQAMLLFILFPFFFTFFQESLAEASNSSVASIFKNMTNPDFYNKWFMPLKKKGEPMEVQIKVYVYHIQTRESSRLEVNMQILLELLWRDERLSYSEESTGLKMIMGGKDHLKAIWTPHVFFTNQMESNVMGSISKDDFMTLLPSGLVLLTTRLKSSMTCVLHLAKFPFDQQNCQLSVHTWTYNSSDIKLVWEKTAPLQFKQLESNLAEFDVLSVENEYTSDDPELICKKFNKLKIVMRLARRYGYYFINYYLPSVLIVTISWVSFWLQPSAVPGRVTIGASTMLTFIQLCWSANGGKKISQFMANDVWAVTCTAFIFLSLAEFAFVNSIDRKGGGKKVVLKKLSSKYILRGGVDTAVGRARLRRSSSCPSSPEIRRHFARKQDRSRTIKELKEVSISLGNLVQETSNDRIDSGRSGSINVFSMTPQEIASWIDAKSKIVFPVAFVLFNIIYWLPLIIVK